MSFEGYDQEELRLMDEIEEVELFEEDEVNHYDKTRHLFGPSNTTKNRADKSDHRPKSRW